MKPRTLVSKQICATLLLAVQAFRVDCKIDWATPSLKQGIVILPEHAHVASGGHVVVICAMQMAATSCHFRLRHGQEVDGAVVDLSRGNMTEAATVQIGGSTSEKKYTVKYSGTGLESGQCGVTLSNLVDGRYIVGCWTTDVTGRMWSDTMSLTVDAKTPIHDLRISPRTSVILPNSDVTILCKTSTPLTNCVFLLPRNGGTVTMFLGNKGAPLKRHQYFGKGLEHGHCGLAVFNATEDDNGIYWCRTNTAGGFEQRAAVIVVARKPISPPEIRSPYYDTMAGEDKEMYCEVADSRPAPELYWSLGSDVIRQEKVQYTLTPSHPWPWDVQTVSERLSLKVSWKDEGKSIQCIAEQVATRSLQYSDKLTVQMTCNNNRIGWSVGGRRTDIMDSPWHAGIYQRETKNINDYMQICGGSLISLRFIVTAAHCLWDETTRQTVDKNVYKVALGKSSRNWNQESTSGQRFDVAHIFVHPGYIGSLGSFQHDIALVQLSSDAALGFNVERACVDWDNVFPMQPGDNGTVSGWGVNEEGVSSEHLMSVDLPYVPTSTCNNLLVNSVKARLTSDKFCAGHTGKNISVCGGDSGGGLVFWQPRGASRFLRGIASVSFQPDYVKNVWCYYHQVTAFTAIAEYVDWMKGVVDESRTLWL